MEKIKLQDYVSEDNWRDEWIKALDVSKVAGELLNKAVDASLTHDEVEYSIAVVKNFIASVRADINTFSYCADYLKSSYDKLNELIYMCPQTLSGMQDIKANKEQHEYLFEQLQDLEFGLAEKTNEYESKLNEIIEQDDDVDIFVEKIMMEGFDEISQERKELIRFCQNDIVPYLSEVEDKIYNQVYEYVELSEENADDSPTFLS